MNDWYDYYKTRVGKGYAKYCKERYGTFLKHLTCMPKDTSFRDEGCGIATQCRILLDAGFKNVSGFDLSKKQVKAGKRNTDHRIPIYVGDITKAHPKVDVIFGHGVLEHFNDEVIDSVLFYQQRDARKKVVHYVPTDGYATPSFGDERLMSVEWWVKKTRPSHYETFNKGKDLVMVWDCSE